MLSNKQSEPSLTWTLMFAAAMFVFGWYGIVRKLYLDKFVLLFALNIGGLLFFALKQGTVGSRSIRRKDVPGVVLLSATALANDFLMFWAYDYSLATSVPIVRQISFAFIFFLAPFITLERSSKAERWGIVFSLLGLSLFYGGDVRSVAGMMPQGFVLALASAFCNAMSILLYRRLGLAEVPIDRVNVWRFVFGSAALLFVPQVREIPHLDPRTLYAFALALMVFGILGNALYTYSVGRIRPFRVELLNKTVALWGALFAYVILGERISFLSICGGCIIAASSVAVAIRGSKANEKQ